MGMGCVAHGKQGQGMSPSQLYIKRGRQRMGSFIHWRTDTAVLQKLPAIWKSRHCFFSFLHSCVNLQLWEHHSLLWIHLSTQVNHYLSLKCMMENGKESLLLRCRFQSRKTSPSLHGTQGIRRAQHFRRLQSLLIHHRKRRIESHFLQTPTHTQ